MTTSPRAATGGLARAYAAVVVSLRYLIVAGWVAAVAAAVAYLPPLTQSSGVASLVPPSSPALQAESTATRMFGEPLDAQAIVVQRAAERTARLGPGGRRPQRGERSTPGGPLAARSPVWPARCRYRTLTAVFPGSRERSTTVLTYLYFRPSASAAQQLAGSELYASRYASARPITWSA